MIWMLEYDMFHVPCCLSLWSIPAVTELIVLFRHLLAYIFAIGAFFENCKFTLSLALFFAKINACWPASTFILLFFNLILTNSYLQIFHFWCRRIWDSFPCYLFLFNKSFSFRINWFVFFKCFHHHLLANHMFRRATIIKASLVSFFFFSKPKAVRYLSEEELYSSNIFFNSFDAYRQTVSSNESTPSHLKQFCFLGG